MPKTESDSKQERRGIPSYEYYGNPIYKEIARRLDKRHKINIANHINVMEKIGTSVGQGITFEPKDGERLKNLLKMAKFTHDNRKYFVDRIAASQTDGEGYREVGSRSLHAQVAPTQCNIHLDNFGFVAIGLGGQKYYNPDSGQHIVGDLVWDHMIVGFFSKKFPPLEGILGRTHPVIPNSRNGYKLEIGGRFDLMKGEKWGIGLEATWGLSGGNKYMIKAEGWEF